MWVTGKLIKIADTIVRKRENYIDNYGVKYDESAKLITTILHNKAYKSLRIHIFINRDKKGLSFFLFSFMSLYRQKWEVIKYIDFLKKRVPLFENEDIVSLINVNMTPCAICHITVCKKVISITTIIDIMPDIHQNL